MAPLSKNILLTNNSSHSVSSAKSLKLSFQLDLNQTVSVPATTDLSRDEIGDVWYSKDDYRRMESTSRILKRMMSTGRFDESKDGEDFSFRGLETDSEKLARQQRIKNARNTALKLQKSDSERLSEKLRRLSISSTRDALIRARRDAMAADADILLG